MEGLRAVKGYLGEGMHIYDFGDYACLIVPLIVLIIIIVIMVFFKEIKSEDIEEKKKERKLVVFIVILIVSILILSLTIYSYYQRYVVYEPYRGWYGYQVKIEYNAENKSNIEIDLPLPHDNRIYSELEFSKSYESQYLDYSINNSEYGKILHIVTNDSLDILSQYSDDNNEINPSLRLSTQDNNVAFVRLTALNFTNISMILFYKHSWPISPVSFSEKTQYLSISKEPFYVPDKILDNQVPELTDIFSEEGAELSLEWNQLNITKDEYLMLE